MLFDDSRLGVRTLCLMKTYRGLSGFVFGSVSLPSRRMALENKIII